MHVTAPPLIVLALALALVLPACDGAPGAAKAGVSPIGSAATSSAKSSAAPDPAFLALALRARDAATEVATDCDLVRASEDRPFRAALAETCGRWSVERTDTLRDAAAALRAFPSPPRTGAAASFVEEVRLFADWVALVRDLWRQRGTLRHYQELARAWNAWRPTDLIAIDVGGYPRQWKGPYAPDGGLAWERCADGPCVYQAEDN